MPATAVTLAARSMSQTTNKIGTVVGVVLSVVVVVALMVAILWRSMALGEHEEGVVATMKRVGHRHHESVQVNYLATLTEVEMHNLEHKARDDASDTASLDGKSIGGSTLNGSEKDFEKERNLENSRDQERERDFEKEPRLDQERERRG